MIFYGWLVLAYLLGYLTCALLVNHKLEQTRRDRDAARRALNRGVVGMLLVGVVCGSVVKPAPIAQPSDPRPGDVMTSGGR